MLDIIADKIVSLVIQSVLFISDLWAKNQALHNLK